jgi:hypothetical protein
MIKVTTQSEIKDLDLLAKIAEKVEPKDTGEKDKPVKK